MQGTLVEPVSVQEMLNSALWAKCGSVVHFSFGAKGSTTTEQNYSVLTSAAIIISLFFVFVFLFCFCLYLFVSSLLSYHLCRPQRYCSRTAHPNIPASGLIQGLFRIEAPPPKD